MGKLLVVIALALGVGYVWHKGWLGEWLGAAVDSSADSMRDARRNATKVRPIDTPPPAEKR